jgi:hypothetical protein
MNSDSKKNPAPIAPTSADPSNASSATPRYTKAPEKGTLVKKTGNAKGGTDPYKQAKPSRKNVMGQGARGTGARYGVRVKFQKTTAPEAGATQSNGRIFASAVRRQKPNFTAGSADLN